MHALTVSLEVEERRQETAVGEASVWVTELIKERMSQSIQLHEHQNIALVRHLDMQNCVGLHGINCVVRRHSQLRTVGVASTEEAWRPDPLLQVAFFC
jgi:hypothetical protein